MSMYLVIIIIIIRSHDPLCTAPLFGYTCQSMSCKLRLSIPSACTVQYRKSHFFQNKKQFLAFNCIKNSFQCSDLTRTFEHNKSNPCSCVGLDFSPRKERWPAGHSSLVCKANSKSNTLVASPGPLYSDSPTQKDVHRPISLH